ncbi:DUF2789 domain-containing protein [Thalassotalea ponticola]|uniref:DUF2789 domain-containing protein n=1 Tax=Thalassotalea ponticola TaxID=1523392 RepID=UPI0025B3F8AB|nr:DUF2789 domain-containing protein [Thalassotalea ponticola]MDN3652597.1 DUF2789 domain-containing protein [Thalassotalea ponticola]
MDLSHHSLELLFEQLGLESSPKAMQAFVEHNKGLPRDMHLSDAPFWSDSQARFLQQAIEQDSDWCEVVDVLDSMLR